MANALIYLNRELEPLLTEKEYKELEQDLSRLFKQTYSQKYTCKECSENCIFDVKNDLQDMIIPCWNGILDDEEKVNPDELVRFKFNLKSSLKILSEKNGINFNFIPKTSNIVLFGEKRINSKNYKFFYINRLVLENRIKQNLIFQLKEYFKTNEIAFIITPAEFILDNSSELFLKEHSCELICLKNLLDDNFLINNVGITNDEDIKRISSYYELAIFNAKEVYFNGKQIKLHPQPYKLLYYLAENPSTAKTRNECIVNVWKEDSQYLGYDKILSDNCSLIRKSLKDAGIKEKVIKDLIIAKQGCIKLNLDKSNIFKA